MTGAVGKFLQRGNKEIKNFLQRKGTEGRKTEKTEGEKTGMQGLEC